MKIVIAPNAFKGSLTAQRSGKAMAQGALRACADLTLALHPIADGGDGFASVLGDALHLRKTTVSVTGPLRKKITAPLYFNSSNSLVVIELATIAGLSLLSSKERNPMLTTSYGLGEAIKIALDAGVKQIMIGLGGSATNDAGIGMASALGIRFLNRNGKAVKPIGLALEEIVDIDLSQIDKRLNKLKLTIACDVDNPLYGAKGAAMVYASQKGASAEQIAQLDKGLRQFADVVKAKLSVDLNAISGAGAAGGIGGTLAGILGATLLAGIDLVLDSIEFNKSLHGASLVLTGEGRADGQTLFGKAPLGVAKRARKNNVPCILLAGSIDSKTFRLEKTDLFAAHNICAKHIPLDVAMDNAYENLEKTTKKIVRHFLATVK